MVGLDMTDVIDLCDVGIAAFGTNDLMMRTMTDSSVRCRIRIDQSPS